MTKTSNKAVSGEPKRMVEKRLVKCVTCAHALLHRYGCNPILAACLKKPQERNERFPYQIEVARCLRSCSLYAEATGEKKVEQRAKTA